MFKGIFSGTVEVGLHVPLKWEDRTIKVIELDFSKVNGRLINDCQKETFGNFEGNSSVLVIPSRVPEYCARFAAAISGVPFRALEKMNMFDYENVTGVVSAYLNKKNPKKFWDEYVKALESEEEEDSDPLSPPDAEPDKSTAA